MFFYYYFYLIPTRVIYIETRKLFSKQNPYSNFLKWYKFYKTKSKNYFRDITENDTKFTHTALIFTHFPQN